MYAQTGIKMVKLYGPSIALGTLSLGCLLQSSNILRKRNVALAAAYATVDKGFKQYRGRVVERFGDAVDRELRYNIKAKEVEEIVVDENGNETVVKKTINVVNQEDISEFGREFSQYTVNRKGKTILNPYWQPDNDYNLVFLKKQEQYANQILRSKGYLILNDVYDMLGLPPTKEGHIIGWIYCEDEANPMGDNYVDFGLNNNDVLFSDDDESSLVLDFNVDGSIWEYM